MLSSLFDHVLPVDPSTDLELTARAAPARWCVYLFADEHDQPIQLLCVRNLRASLRTRLGPPEDNLPSKRVNYRELVRRIYYTRVDSLFESDLTYLRTARLLFPKQYSAMVGFRPAWFIHVDPDAPFPRYVRTLSPHAPSGTVLGPFEDKSAAGKFIEQIEDFFDLCRYENVLLQSPHGKACAYKEMGKCPAPCDGSVSMDQYRQLVALSLATVIDPASAVRAHHARMTAAAGALQFELAARIKHYIASLETIGTGPTRFLRKTRDLQYLAFQRGPREKTAKLFLVTPSRIELALCLTAEPARPGEILRQIFTLAEEHRDRPFSPENVEELSLATHHLFSPKKTTGVFVPVDQLDERTLLRAFRDLQKQKVAEIADDEGVTKELAAS